MKLVTPHFEIIDAPDGEAMIRRIERAGRICYKSETLITEDSARKFVAMIIKRGHHSVLEHVSVSVRFVCSRGMSHEIVRHRLASYSQESTRYCNYGKAKFGGITFTPMMAGLTEKQRVRREALYQRIEDVYLDEIAEGVSPQQARDNLPICLKTELVMTCNLREWRHFFHMRTPKAAHPQLREVTRPLLEAFRFHIPVVFDDVGEV